MCAVGAPDVAECVVTTVGGSAVATGNADGYLGTSRFSVSTGFLGRSVTTSLGVRAQTSVLVADTANNRMRQVSGLPDRPSGGPLVQSFLGSVTSPADIAVTSFVASPTNVIMTVLILLPSPGCALTSTPYPLPILMLTNIVGKTNQCGYAEGTAINGVTTSQLVAPASFCGPSQLPAAICGSGVLQAGSPVVFGCIYIVDAQMVRRATGSYNNNKHYWQTSFVAGSMAGATGCVDATGAAARFTNPTGSALSPDGATVYVADGGCRAIRAVDTMSAAVSTLVGPAGGCSGACPGFPWADGVGAAAVFSGQLRQLQISPDGALLYVADATANRVRAIDVGSRRVFTIAGNSTWAPPIAQSIGGVITARAAPGYRDGAGGDAVFNRINGIALSAVGDNIFTTENPAGLMRAIAVTSATPTVSPSPSVSPTSTGVAIASDALVVNYFAGAPGQPLINPPPPPFGLPLVAADKGLGCLMQLAPHTCTTSAVVFVAVDPSNSCIKIISSDYGMKILAGVCGSAGYADGAGNVAHFATPSGIAFTGAGGTGDIIVADTNNMVLRRIAMAGWNPASLATNLSAGSPSVTVSLFSGRYASTLPTTFSYAVGGAAASLWYYPTRIIRHTSGSCECCGRDAAREGGGAGARSDRVATARLAHGRGSHLAHTPASRAPSQPPIFPAPPPSPRVRSRQFQ